MAEAPKAAAPGRTYPPPKEYAAKAHIKSMDEYQKMYDESISDPESFWGRIAEEFVWKEKWNKVREYTFDPPVSIKWFIGGKTNVSVNCLDRHLEERGDQTAIIWEGNTPGEDAKLTYRDLYTDVCKLANVLKAQGVQKGDRVCIYLQMIPAAAIACLACARIGAVHSVVFGAFQCRCTSRSDQRFEVQGAYHARYGPSRQEERHPDEDQRRQGAGRMPEASRR